MQKARNRPGRRVIPLVLLCVLPMWLDGAADAAQSPATGNSVVTPVRASADPQGPTVRLEEIGAGELLWKSVHGLVPLPVVDIDVDLQVTGIMARGSVTQVFANPTPDVIEAVYVFPLPERAAVDTMEMIIGDRRIVSVLQEKEQARTTYLEAKRDGKKTGLVEQQRSNLFTTAVANINPGETVSVRLEYIGEVGYEDGVFSLVFPLTFTPRFQPEGEARHAGLRPAVMNGTFVRPSSPLAPRARIAASIHAGTPLEYLRSPSHAVHVEGDDAIRHVVPEAGSVVADRDFVLRWKIARGALPSGAVFVEPRDDETYGLLMLVPPTAGGEAGWGLPTETLFVLDVSGSMDGPSIAQARTALLTALDSLRPGDSFNIMVFNTYSETFRHTFSPARGEPLEEARRWIAALRAGGGTDILSPLLRGVEMLSLADPWPARRIILITDGGVGNEEEMFTRVSNGLGDIRLHIIGIGSAPNRYLMRRLALYGRGACAFINAGDELGERMESFLGRIDRPVLTDLRLEWERVPPAEIYPARLPDLYAGEPLFVSLRFPSGRIGTRAVLYGRLADRTVRTELDLTSESPSGSGVATRWARARIGNAIDELHRGAAEPAIRDEVIAVATRFNLVTRYTSLVAVEEVRSAQGDWTTHGIAGSLPQGMRLENGALPMGGTNGPLQMLIALLLICSGLGLRFLARGRKEQG